MATDPTIFILFEVGLLIVVSSLVSGVFKRLRLPGVIGAILVGLFIGGPGGLGLVTDLTVINILAVLGSILILFVTGLEFDAAAFWKVGSKAFLLTTIGVILSVIFGYGIGVALGWGATFIVTKVWSMHTVVSSDIVILAVSVSVGIGLFFVFYPAWQASRLNPIEALRHE